MRDRKLKKIIIQSSKFNKKMEAMIPKINSHIKSELKKAIKEHPESKRDIIEGLKKIDNIKKKLVKILTKKKKNQLLTEGLWKETKNLFGLRDLKKSIKEMKESYKEDKKKFWKSLLYGFLLLIIAGTIQQSLLIILRNFLYKHRKFFKMTSHASYEETTMGAICIMTILIGPILEEALKVISLYTSKGSVVTSMTFTILEYIGYIGAAVKNGNVISDIIIRILPASMHQVTTQRNKEEMEKTGKISKAGYFKSVLYHMTYNLTLVSMSIISVVIGSTLSKIYDDI